MFSRPLVEVERGNRSYNVDCSQWAAVSQGFISAMVMISDIHTLTQARERADFAKG